MPTPSHNETSTRGIAPNAQVVSALAARIGPLAVGAGVIAPKRAMPFSPEALERLERTWRLDAN